MASTAAHSQEAASIVVKEMRPRPRIPRTKHLLRYASAMRSVKFGAAAIRGENYFSMSRCVTFVEYPFPFNVFCTASANITERCFPPVHPKEIVR